MKFGLRHSEWLLLSYFAYVVIITPLFPERPAVHFQPAATLLVTLAAFQFLRFLARRGGRVGLVVDMVRDWLPVLLTLVAFREMEWFLPRAYPHRYEAGWVQQDHWLLHTLGLRAAIERPGWAIPFYLETCYVLTYALAPVCVGLLYARRKRSAVDRFLTIYLVGTLLAYACFPFFPSEPPRIMFAGLDTPTVTTWMRRFNLFILRKGTIHIGVFPSAHVSSAFSAVWGWLATVPERRALGGWFLVYAVSVSAATIYGRYHYTADVLAGVAVSGAAAAVAFALRRTEPV